MSQQQFTGSEDRFLRRYEYNDQWIVAADLPADAEVDVDVVGTTALVVLDHGDRIQETEFEIPGSATTIDVNNSVLTITIEK